MIAPVDFLYILGCFESESNRNIAKHHSMAKRSELASCQRLSPLNRQTVGSMKFSMHWFGFFLVLTKDLSLTISK